MFRFTIRDVLWLTVVVALGVGWWDASRRAMNRESFYKLWAFDIAVDTLEKKTGEKMSVDQTGVWIVQPDGSTNKMSVDE